MDINLEKKSICACTMLVINTPGAIKRHEETAKHRQKIAMFSRSDALVDANNVISRDADAQVKITRESSGVRWCTDVWDTILSFTRIRQTGLDHYRSLYDTSREYRMYRYLDIRQFIDDYYGELSVINAPEYSQLRVLMEGHRRPPNNTRRPILSNILKLYQKASHLEYMAMHKRWMTLGGAIAEAHTACLPVGDRGKQAYYPISAAMTTLLKHTMRKPGQLYSYDLGQREFQRIVGLHGIELMNNYNIVDNHADKSSTLRDSLQRYVEYIELLI
jgi:hypothetical protein